MLLVVNFYSAGDVNHDRRVAPSVYKSNLEQEYLA
jgi:hypothetical protein